MSFLTINDKQVYYEEKGNRNKPQVKNIILLHGAGGTHQRWANQIDFLARDYQVFAPDLPGYGQSQGAPPASIMEYCQFLKQFTETLNLSSFILGGHSMGGAITLKFALNYPKLLTGLILVGTGARLRVLPELIESLSRGTYPANFVTANYSPCCPPALIIEDEKELAHLDPALFLAGFKACDGFDEMLTIKDIHLPTLIICGRDDVKTPEKYAAYIHKQIVPSQLQIIEKAGHMVMHEQPEAVNRAILSFLATL